MTEEFSELGVSPMKPFYDGLSDEEKLALADSEGWSGLKEGLVAIAIRDVSDIPPDDAIDKYGRITFLRFTTQSGDVRVFSFAHDYAIDLTKVRPVEYGLSNDSFVDKWTILEWARAREAAIAHALETIDKSDRLGLILEFVQIERGQQIQL